jgi:hypothetical protein
MRKSTIVHTLVVVAVLLTAATALAGKSRSTLNLVVLSSSEALAATAAEPSYGDQITFDVSTTATDRPFVNVRCYQDGAWVYDGWHGFFESYGPEPNFTLSAPGYWEGGAADCTARLVKFDSNGRERTLASLGFHVGA